MTSYTGEHCLSILFHSHNIYIIWNDHLYINFPVFDIINAVKLIERCHLKTGRIVKSISGVYQVDVNGERFNTKPRGLFRKKNFHQ